MQTFRVVPAMLLLIAAAAAGEADDRSREAAPDPAGQLAMTGELVLHSATNTVGVDAITIPRMLSYQGKLTDDLGNPVADTTYNVTFRLYTQPTGGSAFWNEVQTVRTKSGLFSVLLGSVAPIGSMPDAGAAYLGMQVESGPELAPRLRLASAAYSFLAERAANADALQGKDTTAFDSRYVNEGQANSVSTTMIADGTIAAADLGQMGAATGQVMKWTGSAWAPRNDSVGGGAGGTVTSVAQATGVVCTPNPITATGTVGFDQTYGDGRYLNVTGDSVTDDLAIQDELRVYDRARIGPNCQNAANQSFVVGDGCVASGNRASVTGGWQNRVTASDASVAGGAFNLGAGLYSFVGSGYADTANARYGGALSGYGNVAGDASTDSAPVVAGGYANRATASYSAVGGGLQNYATGHAAAVAGGFSNRAAGSRAQVGGGYSGLAAGNYSAVVGGYADTAYGDYCAVGGGSQNAASGSYSTVSGGRNNRVSASYGTISGGYANTCGSYGTVGGGNGNSAVGSYTSVLGGYGNYADNSYAIAAGRQDTAWSFFSAVLSGYGNTAGTFDFETSAVVVAGVGNKARWAYCTVGGGRNNTAGGTAATVMGGTECYVSGNWASAVGEGDTVRGGSGFAAGSGSMIPSGVGYAYSAVFNGQTATGGSQLRCDDLNANSMGLVMDHPLRPDGMLLRQYAGAGPEMLLTFRGSVVIGADGRAEAVLPDYFSTLCRNPMIQLTGVGTSDVYVAAEVSSGGFTIGGRPDTKVYWTVTAERNDDVARMCRILSPVEQPKTGAWAGRSIADASLANRMPALAQAGAAGGFRFRTAAGRERYERSLRVGSFGENSR